MTHDEFMKTYSNSLYHEWATSKDPNKYAEQKKREKEYNAEYYQKHKNLIYDRESATWRTKDGKIVNDFSDDEERRQGASALARMAFGELREGEKRQQIEDEWNERNRQANVKSIAEKALREIDTANKVSARQQRQRIYDANANASKAQISSLQSRNAANADKRAKQAGLKAVQNYMVKAEANTTAFTKIQQVARVAINKGKQLVEKIKSYFS